jgi:hypothetical protein
MSKAYDRYATLANQQSSRYSGSHEGQKMRLPRSGALVVLRAEASVQRLHRKRENTCDLSRLASPPSVLSASQKVQEPFLF